MSRPLHNPDAAWRKSRDGAVIEFYTRPPLWRRIWLAVWRWL